MSAKAYRRFDEHRRDADDGDLDDSEANPRLHVPDVMLLFVGGGS